MRDEETDGRLGDLLGSTLRAYADEAPQAHHGELAATARRRIRGRRHKVVGTVVAVVAFAGIGGAWTALQPQGNGTATAGDEAAGAARDSGVPTFARSGTATGSTPADTRVVTYRGVAIPVPDGWTTGTSNWPWCLQQEQPASGGTSTGEVGVPGPVPDVACPESSAPVAKLSQHVWLSPSSAKPGRRTEALGAGWIRDTVVVPGVAVEIQTRNNPALRSRFLAAVGTR